VEVLELDMPLELSKVKRLLQDHLQEGLLIVVGSGLSAAEGIPGMGALAEHLKRVIPSRLTALPDPAWSVVVAALDADDNLEAAMGKANLLPTTVEIIVAETAKLISDKERIVFARVLAGERELPFTQFVKGLFKTGKKFHLITTNYDRLIEFATEAAEIGVDSRFFGYLHGRSDPKRSADAHRDSYFSSKNAQFRNLPCLCVHKPHGSLDWFDIGGKIVRCPIETEAIPMIITPGAAKYRESFRVAFDGQRNAGNRAASNANRLMFIGYGFNDDHLEPYLCPNLRLTKPTVIVTQTLTENAMKVIENSNETEVIALCAKPGSGWTRIVNQDGEELTVAEQLWNLEGFIKGVL
jgi:NAD-dependent SIR2 family protein deacetylase